MWTVQILLGHKDLRMTTRYAPNLSQEHLQQAMKLLERSLRGNWWPQHGYNGTTGRNLEGLIT